MRFVLAESADVTILIPMEIINCFRLGLELGSGFSVWLLRKCGNCVKVNNFTQIFLILPKFEFMFLFFVSLFFPPPLDLDQELGKYFLCKLC